MDRGWGANAVWTEEARGWLEDHAGVLTRRQAEVARLLAEGKTVGEAAAALGVALSTVRNHVDHTRLRIAVFARQAGEGA